MDKYVDDLATYTSYQHQRQIYKFVGYVSLFLCDLYFFNSISKILIMSTLESGFFP